MKNISPKNKEDKLASNLIMMLQEASLRSNKHEAVQVISGILLCLKHDFPELSLIANNWKQLNHQKE